MGFEGSGSTGFKVLLGPGGRPRWNVDLPKVAYRLVSASGKIELKAIKFKLVNKNNIY
jgi:hypothetical protein